jgi:hypothetical protein
VRGPAATWLWRLIELNQISLSLTQFSHGYCGEHVMGQMTSNMTFVTILYIYLLPILSFPQKGLPTFLFFLGFNFQPIESKYKRKRNQN